MRRRYSLHTEVVLVTNEWVISGILHREFCSKKARCAGKPHFRVRPNAYRAYRQKLYEDEDVLECIS